MSSFASPLQIAAVTAAVAWPLAAGLGVVAWSKLRAGAHSKRVAKLDGKVRGLYRTLESTPVPQRFSLVVDALEEGDAIAAAGAQKHKPARARARA